MYIHCVLSRVIGHHHSSAKMLVLIIHLLVADELANDEEPKDARRGYAIAIAIMGRRQPGFFRLFAIGELDILYRAKIVLTVNM